ncbi:unnamed protein product, partial [Didymodactylos carnosus]
TNNQPIFEWRSVTNDLLPLNKCVAGHRRGGLPIYVGRAYHNYHLIPGTVLPTHDCIYVPYNGSAHHYTSYEVLTNPNDYKLQWIISSNGNVPKGAIKGGHESNGEIYYIGRVACGGAFESIGKVHPSLEVLYVPYGSKEWCFEEYEVLCLETEVSDEDDNSGDDSVTDSDGD